MHGLDFTSAGEAAAAIFAFLAFSTSHADLK
jgi:hypothetical protein